MNGSPNITVIIPVYNAADSIERCLGSLLRQSDSDFNVICVDDCSLDNSLLLLERAMPLFEGRMKFISNETNMGGGASRMSAVGIADSEYVVFLDSDDYVSENYIERFRLEMGSSPDIVVAGYTKDYGGRKKRYRAPSMPWCLTTYSISCAKMYKRKFLVENQIGFSGIRCGEDILFGLELFSSTPAVKVIDYFGYNYTFNKASITNTMGDGMERNVAEIFSQFSMWLGSRTLSEYQSQVVECVYFANMVNALLVYSRGCGLASMNSKVDFFFSDCGRRFPGLFDNSLLHFGGLKGQSAKIRISVAMLTRLHSIGLDRLVYKLFSL